MGEHCSPIEKDIPEEGHPSRRGFDTFVFDLDGTLLDTVQDLIDLTNRIMRELDAPEHDRDEVLSYIGDGVSSYLSLALPDDASEADLDAAKRMWNEWFLDHYDSADAYDGIPELLQGLRERGCKVAVVSNRDHEGVGLVVSHSPLDGFDLLLGTSETIPRKPDPSGIQHAIDEMGSVPSRTMYVGDTPSDIVAGREAGCATAAVTWGYNSRDALEAAGPDIVVDDPLQLLAYAR